jgi:hypothetical protein
VATQNGSFLRVRRLFEAAERLRMRCNQALAGHNMPAHERYLAIVQAAPVIEGARAQCEPLIKLEDIVSYALQEDETAVRPTPSGLTSREVEIVRLVARGAHTA